MATSGYKLSHEGVQVAVFPSQQINITQGENSSYSHYGTLNVDNACYSNMRDLYAPVDMVCVRNYYSGGYGIVIYHTVNEVYMADGSKGHFTMVLMHDNRANRWQVGKTYYQGDHIYTEGDADPSGLTDGIHVHYEMAKGHQIDRVISVDGGRYHIVNQEHIDNIFYKNGTQVISENASGSWHGDRTFSFKEYDGSIDPEPPSNEKNTILVDLGHMEVNMKQGETYKVVGVNGKKVTMELQGGSTSLVGKTFTNKTPLTLRRSDGSAYVNGSRVIRSYKILAESGGMVKISHHLFDPNEVWVNVSDGIIQ